MASKEGGEGSNHQLPRLSAAEVVAVAEELELQAEGADGGGEVEAQDGPDTEAALAKDGAGAAQEDVGEDEERY